MSTRRARIKAVAALPQRRKNVNTNKKQVLEKDLAVIVDENPDECRESGDNNPSGSPAKDDLFSPRKCQQALTHNPEFEKSNNILSPISALTEPNSSITINDKTDDEEPATCRSNIFVPPRARASPLRRRLPTARNPMTEEDIGVEKIVAPHKTLFESQDNDNNSKQLPKCKDNSESLKAQSGKGPNNRNNVLDDYNNPSQSKTDANFIDGIEPLNPLNNEPKFIGKLKSDIISDNVEVQFDPIVPLPSSSKVRHKLRPVLRLGPKRRKSMPGSASESEDESRRGLQGASSTSVPPSRQRNDSHTSHSTMQSLPKRDVSRAKNDPASSNVTQLTHQSPAPWDSPIKDKYSVRNCRIRASKRMAAERRRNPELQKEPLTMFDLIFYNPVSNPIVPDQEEINAKAAAIRDEEERRQRNKNPEATKTPNDANKNTAASVPQVKLGPNGDIIIDDESLVIRQPEERQISDTVVREGPSTSSTSSGYRRRPRTAGWSDGETVRFYRALAAFGTDFSVMTTLFPGRDRRDLKLKYKKEERTNQKLVEKALSSPTDMDMDRLVKEFAEHREADKEKAERKKQEMIEMKKAVKELKRAEKQRKRAISGVGRRRLSKAQKLFGESVMPEERRPINTDQCNTADQFIENILISKMRKRQIAAAKKLAQEKSELVDDLPMAKTSKRLLKVGSPHLDSPIAINTDEIDSADQFLERFLSSKMRKRQIAAETEFADDLPMAETTKRIPEVGIQFFDSHIKLNTDQINTINQYLESVFSKICQEQIATETKLDLERSEFADDLPMEKTTKRLPKVGIPRLDSPTAINTDQINTADQFLEKFLPSEMRKRQIAAETKLDLDIAKTTKLLPKVGIPHLDSPIATLNIRKPITIKPPTSMPMATYNRTKPVSTPAIMPLTLMAIIGSTDPVSTPAIMPLTPVAIIGSTNPVSTPAIMPLTPMAIIGSTDPVSTPAIMPLTPMAIIGSTDPVSTPAIMPLTPMAITNSKKPVTTPAIKLITPMALVNTKKSDSTPTIKLLTPMTMLNTLKPVSTPTLKQIPQKSPVIINPMPSTPANIAPASLVVLTVNDPTAPSQKAVHTYIKQADGSISSVVVDPNVMSSIINNVKKDTPKAGSSSTMPPCSVVNDTPPALAWAIPNKVMKYNS